MTPPFIVETSRLQLREMDFADLDFLADMLADPEVMRYFPKTQSRDEAREWLDRQLGRYAQYGHAWWLVLDRATGERVGQVGLIMQEVDDAFEPEIGYMIHRPFWRRGLATEAALGVRSHAFKQRNLPRVISLIRPENEPSQGVARKLGMNVERETMFRGYRHFVFSVRRDGV